MSAPDSETDQQQQPSGLRVQDALGYLDQVKLKFEDQPFVYTQFLDIMKDFKSQALDTPGVIDQVSTLFRGHTDLIVGFNTFLPPGYRIEQMAHNEIRITTPGYNQVSTSDNRITRLPPTTQPSQETQPQTQTQQAQQQLPQQQQTQQQQSQPLSQQTQQPTSQTTLQQHQPTKSQQHPQPAVQKTDQSQIQPQSVPIAQSSPQLVPSHAQSNSSTSANIMTGTNQIVQQANASMQPGTEFGFNHALNYVNKIKHRFSANPEVYQQFLEILHKYQQDQHATKVPRSKMILESEVYNHVARLFQNQQDLLEEFSQFLPDANGTGSASSNINSLTRVHHQISPDGSINSNPPNLSVRLANDGSVVIHNDMAPSKRQNARGANHHSKMSLKRQNNSANNMSFNSTKRPRMTSLRDVSLAEAGKHGSLNEYAFFDKVRKALKSSDVYDNFLRCLLLYNHEIISRTELLGLATNFIGRFPELLRWFKEFLGLRDGPASNQAYSIEGVDIASQPAQNRQRERERLSTEPGMEIDYSSCKRHGASYRGLPMSFVQPKCSGRTSLCKEVLNDTLVSFPSWSEDSTFVSSRKTQFEEYIYRCEDERFELDIVIESNLLTIRVLEAVKRKIDKLNIEERNRFKLDDTLGGTSRVIHQRVIRRIYGDKAPDVIEGLKKNPVVAVPLVLRRLKAKDEEWRDAQKQFNKIWREQNEKYYLKSLDHQGITFKQNDVKYLRCKSLIKEIEDLHRENQDDDLNASSANGGADMAATTELNSNVGMPHITLSYKDKDMLEEACSLIIHHVKRQTSIHKDEKQKIKQLMRQYIPDLFFAPRGELSDDEVDENDEQMDDDAASGDDRRNEGCGNENNKKSSTNDSRAINHKSSKDNTVTSPKITSRYNNNRESPKLSCDESPLKDPELREPIRPEQQKYLSDIDCQNKNDEAIPISLDEREQQHPNKLEPLSVITENSNNNKEHEGNNQVDTHQKENSASFLKSPQQALQNKDPEDSYQLFYFDDKWYCFFRLHHILCQRLGSLYERSRVMILEEQKDRKDRKESTAIALRLKPRNDIDVEDYFPVFVDMIKQLLDGNLEGNQYEDMLRDMFGIHAYVAFTMDKLVSNIVRQLQHMVSDSESQRCYELFLDESNFGATGGPCATAQARAMAEANYLKRAEQLLEDENCYKATMYKNESKLTIELLDSDSQSDDEDDNSNDKWSNHYRNDASTARDRSKNNHHYNHHHSHHHNNANKKWFLKRNIRRYIERQSKLNRNGKASNEISSSTTASQESTAAPPNDMIKNGGGGGGDFIQANDTKKNKIISQIQDKSETASSTQDDQNKNLNNDCSFDPKACGRLLIFNNGDHVFFYRHQRPTKSQHSVMSDIKRKKFLAWRTKWIETHLTDDDIRKGIEWIGK